MRAVDASKPVRMNPTQWQWLIEAASRIPSLFESLKQGSIRADTTLGVRVINGRYVRLSLLAEVVDPGANPLASHASANYPTTEKPPARPDTQHRRRSRPKRW